MKFYRILVLADPAFGSLSLSSQAAIALEDAGHGITSMTTKRSPWLFEAADDAGTAAGKPAFRVREGMLKPFLEKSRPSLVLLFDGISLSEPDLEAAKERKVAIVNADPATDEDGFSLESVETGIYRARFQPSFARSHRSTQLANYIACGMCAVCCDAPGEKSVAAARALRDAMGQEDAPARVVGVGAGWTDDLRVDDGPESLAYAARNAVACVSFGLDREPTVHSACLAEGAPLVQADPEDPESVHAAAKAVAEACARTPRPTEWSQPEEARTSLLDAPDMDEQTECLVTTLETANALPGGFESPAKHACLCGYYGIGNFGDEMIAEHLAQSLQRKHGLVTVRAVCAVAPKAWELHGIETMEPADHAHVAQAVEGSQVLLITAGLLFDQGIRWTPGLASLLGPTAATDLPGLAQICVLAQACGTPAFFYGTGDGPLNVEAGRRCMRTAGLAGARFFTRNARSERLLLECGVPEENVSFAADTLFELEKPDEGPARAWAIRHDADLDARVVVVALRDWPGLPQDWTAVIARQFDRMAQAGCRFLFMEFDPQDAGVHNEVAERMQRKDAVLRYGAITDYEEALSLLGSAWGGFAMRLHCSLIMACFDKPSVGIGYLPKVEALFAELGLEELLVPLSFTEAQLEGTLDALVGEHDRFCEQAKQAVGREKERLAVATDAVSEALETPLRQGERRYWLTARTLSEEGRARQAHLEGCLARSNARIAELENALREANGRAEALESSHSYRIGHALMKIPYTVKRALRK